MWFCGEIERFDSAYGRQRNSPFYGLFHAGVDMAEGLAVVNDFFFHCPVVDGAQYAHVEGCGVGSVATAFQVSLVRFHGFCCQRVKHDVVPVAETAEAVECGPIGFCRAQSVPAFQ